MRLDKVGLALGGGGSKGSYQLGVLKAFEEYGLMKHVDAICGTSIGAINTMLWLTHGNVDHMIDLWHNMDPKCVFREGFTLFKENDGMFTLEKFQDILRESVNFDAIYDNETQGFITLSKVLKEKGMFNKVDKKHLESVTIHINKEAPEDMLNFIIGSASIPYIFESKLIKEDMYVDGGVMDTNPIQPLIDFGCETIFVVPLDYHFNAKDYERPGLTIVDLSSEVLFYKFLLADALDVINFEPKRIDGRAEYGYRVAKTLLNGLIEMDELAIGQRGKIVKAKLPRDPMFAYFRLHEEGLITRSQILKHQFDKIDDTIPLGKVTAQFRDVEGDYDVMIDE